MTTNTQEILEKMRQRNKPASLEELLFSKDPTEQITEAEYSEMKAREAEHTNGGYFNRERLPEHLRAWGDLYHELTKQEAVKFTDWIGTFEEWNNYKLSESDIRAAWLEANRDNGGFPVGRPGSLTTTAVSVKSKMTAKPVPQIDAVGIQQTQQAANNKWNMVFVPRPANVERPKNLPSKRIK